MKNSGRGDPKTYGAFSNHFTSSGLSAREYAAIHIAGHLYQGFWHSDQIAQKALLIADAIFKITRPEHKEEEVKDVLSNSPKE